MKRTYLKTNVHDESIKRISNVFDEFENIYVSFSGGKDSTVMLHLVMDEAIKRNRKVWVLFIDWECQYNLTINHIQGMYDKYKENIIPYWLCIPLLSDNSCSQFEPYWLSWDEEKKEVWAREKQEISIKDPSIFDFYTPKMTFEEFITKFSYWYAKWEKTAAFVWIRTVESLNRYRAIARWDKNMYKDLNYSTNVLWEAYNFYPIYDWTVDDIWTYTGKFKKEYNKIYDRMYQAGLTISQMRVDEPYGDKTRRSLWLYKVIEPETWTKVVARVSGVNYAWLYWNTKWNILGQMKISLPKWHTWKSFAEFLLKTMPTRTAEHYKNKFAVYIKWHSKKWYPDGIPDSWDYALEQKGLIPSWRMICKTLLRNDYWCRGLWFWITKSSCYEKYLERIKSKREEWGILNK